jgi:hypothetical protein
MNNQPLTPGMERRAHVRYSHSMKTSCRLLGKREGEAWAARVGDLSRSGATLIADVEVRPGTVLVVALEGMGGRFARPMLMRVMNLRARPDNRWQLGCAFVKALSEDDVQALLLAPPS